MTAAPGRTEWWAPRRDGALADAATQIGVQGFLAVEAEAFDDREYVRWAELVEEDFTYQVPVPVIRDNPFAPTYDPGSLLVDETKESIVDIWFQRLAGSAYDIAWGDHPPLRFRHFVTNVRVRHTDEPDVLLARSYVRLRMVRQATRPAELAGERFDLVRRVPDTADGWRLRSRFVVLDDTVLDAPQIRVML